MALTPEEIADHPALPKGVRQQSQLLFEAFRANPRTGAVFATQQRWLLAHIGLYLFFRGKTQDGHSAMHAARVLNMATEHKVASRNTADAFLHEMLAYDVIRLVDGAADKRLRLFEPSPTGLVSLKGWAMVHLATLDTLDGGERVSRFVSTPNALGSIEPEIALRLLTSPAVREPQTTFSLFTWLNQGGAVMDWLIAGIDPADTQADRIPTGVMSTSDMATWLKLSRTHLTRKLRQAEAMGSLGWQGERGRSRMWVSQGFYREYMMAQAVKLSIFDEAYDACTQRNWDQPEQSTQK